MKILVLGDGLLGSYIIAQTGWDYLCQSKDDIDVVERLWELFEMIDEIQPDVIVNCIGHTDTYSKERDLHWKLNFQYVANLANFCDTRDMKLVHISTDYIYAQSQGGFGENDIPVHQETWYSYTKLLSDGYVQLMDDYLLIRCGFKPTPFPYEKAYGNVKGTFDYVDTIAEQIVELIKEKRWGVWNIGTPSKTMYELAKQTRPDIGEWYSDKLPSITLDLSKFQNR